MWLQNSVFVCCCRTLCVAAELCVCVLFQNSVCLCVVAAELCVWSQNSLYVFLCAVAKLCALLQNSVCVCFCADLELCMHVFVLLWNRIQYNDKTKLVLHVSVCLLLDTEMDTI